MLWCPYYHQLGQWTEFYHVWKWGIYVLETFLGMHHKWENSTGKFEVCFREGSFLSVIMIKDNRVSFLILYYFYLKTSLTGKLMINWSLQLQTSLHMSTSVTRPGCTSLQPRSLHCHFIEPTLIVSSFGSEAYETSMRKHNKGQQIGIFIKGRNAVDLRKIH